METSKEEVVVEEWRDIPGQPGYQIAHPTKRVKSQARRIFQVGVFRDLPERILAVRGKDRTITIRHKTRSVDTIYKIVFGDKLCGTTSGPATSSGQSKPDSSGG